MNQEMRAPIVYCVQEPMRYDPASGGLQRSIDLTPAEEYGELRFLFSTDRAPRDQTAILLHLLKELANFQATDYLLPTGTPSLICWSAIIAARMISSPLQLLDWNRRDSKYRVLRGDLSEADFLYSEQQRIGSLVG